MDDIDRRKIQQHQEEREAAQEILNDPNANQLARNLAHLRLQHEEGTTGVGSFLPRGQSSGSVSSSVPEEWLAVESYEKGLINPSDAELVALIEDPLIRNKCKTINAAIGPDGNPSVCLAYPRLTQAVENQLGSSNAQEVASANAVMSTLVRAGNRPACLAYLKAAVRLRPKDWRYRNAIASAYICLGKTSLSLQALSEAKDLLPEESLDRFEVESARGKVLFNLERDKEAKASFMRVLVDADRFKEELQLDPLDRAHLVVTEYMLCIIYVKEKNMKMIQRQWESAEKKYKALAPDIRQRINWDARLQAQQIIGMVAPDILSHLECHHCRQLCSDPKRCSACKVAVYCSREHQVAAWKAGHKRECKGAKSARKTEKKEAKQFVKKTEAVSKLPPLDATLDPYALWAKAKKLSKDSATAQDAVFHFCVALFLDFSLDGQDLTAAKTAVEASDPDHPLTLALGMSTHMDRSDPLGHIETNHHRAVTKFEGVPVLDTSESFTQVERAQFGCALCTIFRARIMGRCFSVTNAAQAQSAQHREAFDIILELISSVHLYMPEERWLTIQFELGYTNLDVGAADEANRWLEMFLKSLATLEQADGKLTKHWKKMRKNARTKLQMVPLLRQAQRHGVV